MLSEHVPDRGECVWVEQPGGEKVKEVGGGGGLKGE